MGVKFWKTLEQMQKKITKEFNRNLHGFWHEISSRAKLYSQLKSYQMLSLFNLEKLWLSFYYVPQFCQRCRILYFFLNKDVFLRQQKLNCCPYVMAEHHPIFLSHLHAIYRVNA